MISPSATTASASTTTAGAAAAAAGVGAAVTAAATWPWPMLLGMPPAAAAPPDLPTEPKPVLAAGMEGAGKTAAG